MTSQVVDKKKWIIAVGYTFEVTETIRNAIEDYMRCNDINPDDYNFFPEVQFGVLYDQHCRGVGGSNVGTTQKELELWYNKNHTKQPIGYIKGTWVIQRPNIVGVKIVIASQTHYAFIAKKSERMQTTQFKKELNNGKYKVSLDDTFSIALKPYIHYM